MSTRKFTRRYLLKGTAALGAAATVPACASAAALAPADRLGLVFIGVGGRGRANVGGLKAHNMLAFCDVDDDRASETYKKYPDVPRYRDFRVMFDELGSSIDGVVISTPDHTHYHIARRALEMGKPVYLEKPMAHSVGEVRDLTLLAAEKGVATQLGVQRHALENVHRVVELIQAGTIGEVTEVHCWVDGDRGMPEIPTDTPAVPDHLDWEGWVGPAAMRPYHPSIAPYGWRFWWDYGTGETGNWGCHILDIPFWALGLKYPVRAGGSGPEPHPLTSPKSLATWFDFPAAEGRGPVRLHWYHTNKPGEFLRRHGVSGGGNTLFVGTEGKLLCGFESRKLFPEEKFDGMEAPPQTIPDSPGFHEEWVRAIRGEGPATCAFDYSGPLTETVLLGNVAYRAQAEFSWDAATLRVTGSDAAQALIRPPYRKGWEV